MKFMARRRQKPPTIIIISLIDILIVLLIFMMVTTTFKQKTILNLSLPQSRSESSTQVENQSVVVSIAAQAPHIYLGEQPLSEQGLLAALSNMANLDATTTVIVKPDESAPIKELVKVMDTAKASGLKNIKLRTKPLEAPSAP